MKALDGSLNENNVYQNNYFTQSYIDDLGFSITKIGSNTNYDSGRLFSNCLGKRILGGYLALSGSIIEKNYSNLAPHLSLRLLVTLWSLGYIFMILITIFILN